MARDNFLSNLYCSSYVLIGELELGNRRVFRQKELLKKALVPSLQKWKHLSKEVTVLNLRPVEIFYHVYLIYL